MTDANVAELIAIVRSDLAAHRKVTRELLELLRDQRETNKEMLELMRLVRQDLTTHKGKSR